MLADDLVRTFRAWTSGCNGCMAGKFDKLGTEGKWEENRYNIVSQREGREDVNTLDRVGRELKQV